MDVKGAILQIRRKIAELDHVIKVLEGLNGTSRAAQKRAPKQAAGTQWDQIRSLIETEGRPMKVTEIAARIPTGSRNPANMFGVLVRQKQKRGEIVSVGNGLWTLPEMAKKAKKALAKTSSS